VRVVYFVDDERSILDGLRRSLRSLRSNWKFEFHTSGGAALERMKTVPADVVVSDMRMPGMDGAEFLARVRRDYPDTIRLVLSGHAEFDAISRVMRSAHQVLSKPCEAEQLVKVLESARLLCERFQDRGISSAVSGLGSLPSIPAVLDELMASLERPEVDQRVIGQMVACDPALTVRVLQVANSGFFGARSRIESIDQAVVMLGAEMLKNLVMQVKIVEAFPSKTSSFSLVRFGERVRMITEWGRRIAPAEVPSDELRALAMTMDVGQLVFASRLPNRYEAVLLESAAPGTAVWNAEQRILGVDHAAVGAYLLALWGQDSRLVDRIARHLEPLGAGDDEPMLVAMHVAEVLCECGGSREAFEACAQPGVAEHALVSDRLDGWLAEVEEAMAAQPLRS
jgi:HD-like signal output (HDOD) protein/CheY-like chemotaxis protein